MKDPAAVALGKKSGKRFDHMKKAEKSKFFRELRLKRRDLKPNLLP